MSEKLNSIKPSSRQEKPQTLDDIQATTSLNAPCGSDLSLNRDSDKRLPRNRYRGSETHSPREHSSDGVMTSLTTDLKTNVELYNEFDNNDGRQRRESYNYDDNSPSGNSAVAKSLLPRSVRLPSMVGGTATRKCLLTLDGYSYVIVASSPENLPKRDDLPCSGGSNPSTVCHTQITSSSANKTQQQFSTSDKAAFTNTQSAVTAGGGEGGTGTTVGSETILTPSTSTSLAAGGVNSDSKQDFSNITSPFTVNSTPESICSNISITSNSSLAAINGQVAKHGALTIVRRSSSRKSFSQYDSQHLISTVTTSTPSTTTQHSLLGDLTGKFPSGQTVHDSRVGDFSRHSTTPITPLSITSQVSSASTQPTKTCITTTTAQNTINMLPTSPNSSNTAVAPDDGMENKREDLVPNTASGSTITSSIIDLATDNLPAVDTPDACDKAALRLRSLLHMLNTGEIQVDVLQKNLHYAARVLEAVFLDESKSPTSGKSKLKPNSCSTVECENQGNKQETGKDDRCNSGCKKIDCIQHEHTAHSPNAAVSNQSNVLGNAAEGSDHSGDESNSQTQNASNNQISIDSRTKGVCSAPQTHSGPTGPPLDKNKTPDVNATEDDAAHKQSSGQAASENVSNSSVSSSSCSNKATMQREKRLRTPVWARSLSTNKTYIILFRNNFQLNLNKIV